LLHNKDEDEVCSLAAEIPGFFLLEVRVVFLGTALTDGRSHRTAPTSWGICTHKSGGIAMRNRTNLLTATAVALPLGLGAWGAKAETIYEALQERDELSKFVEAIEAADLQETLENEGPFTVFAPTDEAFEAFPEEVGEALREGDYRDQLEQLVRMHIFEGEALTQAELQDNGTLRPEILTMANEPLSIDFVGDEMKVRLATAEPRLEPQDQATAAQPVDPATEPVDRGTAPTPSPATAQQQPQVAETPDVAEAPEATQPYGEEYEQIGAKHEATVTEADIEADNGVIHVIDAVLVPAPVAQELAGLDLEGDEEG
jgi:uncharacterized surface protein with fasciclin (FAS1) repeats